MEKLTTGGCVFRSERNEDRARREHEQTIQSEMEKLARQIEEHMEKESRQGMGHLYCLSN